MICKRKDLRTIETPYGNIFGIQTTLDSDFGSGMAAYAGYDDPADEGCPDDDTFWRLDEDGNWQGAM